MNDLTGKPELQLSGYAWNPYNLYRTGVPALTLYNPHNPWPKTGKSMNFRDFHSLSSPTELVPYVIKFLLLDSIHKLA